MRFVSRQLHLILRFNLFVLKLKRKSVAAIRKVIRHAVRGGGTNDEAAIVKSWQVRVRPFNFIRFIGRRFIEFLAHEK
jgi:hypothetical protein